MGSSPPGEWRGALRNHPWTSPQPERWCVGGFGGELPVRRGVCEARCAGDTVSHLVHPGAVGTTPATLLGHAVLREHKPELLADKLGRS